MNYYRLVTIAVMLLFISGCATFYQRSEEMMAATYNLNFDEALAAMDNKAFKKSNRNQLLYYCNKGTLLFMKGSPKESNDAFLKADYYVEDFRKNYASEAASFLSNPMITRYEGESFERIMIHYYTALNYLQLNMKDEALVECKRMLLKLQYNNDYFKEKNKYKNDALVHILSGVVYENLKEYNAAYVAYKNAYDIYEQEYSKNLNIPMPEQLKYDLVRTAQFTGFTQEAKEYRKRFNLDGYNPSPKQSALVAFWNNGFGPVKSEWSINFSITPAGNGYVNFVNHDLGLNFPYYAGNDANGIAALKILRVAFPKYTSRLPLFTSAELQIDSLGIKRNFFLAQDIDKIARVSLQDRMLKELSEALLRAALKQLAIAAARSKDEGLGAAMSIWGALSEKADTRNWQTLPYHISYTRIELPPGTHRVTFNTTNINFSVPVTINNGEMVVKVFQSPYFNGYTN
ncbi:MAG: hypothetical protein MUC81_09005 [Bacteroidia bacterium]|jgi:hypothetical protein|nr:hypothetical protein [Bacteroidia bacterium]